MEAEVMIDITGLRRIERKSSSDIVEGKLSVCV